MTPCYNPPPLGFGRKSRRCDFNLSSSLSASWHLGVSGSRYRRLLFCRLSSYAMAQQNCHGSPRCTSRCSGSSAKFSYRIRRLRMIDRADQHLGDNKRLPLTVLYCAKSDGPKSTSCLQLQASWIGIDRSCVPSSKNSGRYDFSCLLVLDHF